MEVIYIQTTKFGYYLAHSLQYLFQKNSIKSYIVYDVDYKNPHLHIILFSQKVKKFPKNYIIYQLEQKDISKWIDKKYELSILFSKKTWDYSYANINKFSDILKRKITYLPVPLIPINEIHKDIQLNKHPQNNILFYGSMNHIRREKLDCLQKKLYPNYFIKIIYNQYGLTLLHQIINSKIILNIHFYKNALLETNRLNEILSCNRFVISEKPNSEDTYNYEMYKNHVCFVDDMNEMYDKIIYYLQRDHEDNDFSLSFKTNNIWNDYLNNQLKEYI